MPTATVVQYSEAMREYIATRIPVLTQEEADYWSRLKSAGGDTVQTNYKGYRAPIETAPHSSFAVGNADGGALAYTGSATLNHLLIPYIWQNSGLEETYAAALNANKETSGDPQRHMIDAVMRAMLKFANIYASNGNGTTRLGIVSANYNGGTPTVLTLNGATDTIGATQLRVGQQVFVYDATGTTQRTGTVGAGAITIASLTKTTVTGSTNWPSDTVATDIIVPVGGLTTGQKGVPYLVANSGNLFNLSRTTVTSLQSTVLSAAGAGLSQALLLKAYNMGFQRIGKKRIQSLGGFEMACNITQHEAYFLLTIQTGSSHQFVHNQGAPQIDLGGASFEFSFFNIPINCYLDFIGTSVFFLTMSAMQKAELKPIGQIGAGFPAGEYLQKYDATLGTYVNARQRWWDDAHDNFTAEPNLHIALTDLDVAGLAMQKS